MKEIKSIDSTSIKPLANVEETQIILQRHCNYNKEYGGLVEESKNNQEIIVESFLTLLKNIDNVENTYFLFTASPAMIASNDFQRCIATTDIALAKVTEYFNKIGFVNNVINVNSNLNYQDKVKKTSNLSEPKMFTDDTGYLEFLKNLSGGLNQDFWINFEEDIYKEERENMQAEGPDEIVARAERYIEILQRYASYFHLQHPNSRLIIWCGTHYDLISPFVKQDIFNLPKDSYLPVDNCGGISLIIDEKNNIYADVNSESFLVAFQYNQQHHRHF